MTLSRPAQTEATTLRIPSFDRDDDQRYSLEAVFEELARYIKRRHGREAERTYRKAMAQVFLTTRPDHYEHVRTTLEGRLNLEMQHALDELHRAANAYEKPIHPL